MTMMPEDLKYTQDHIWVRLEGDSARFGVTENLVDTLGRVISVVLPDVGREADESIELAQLTGSTAGVCDLFSPLPGLVDEVNEALLDDPDLIRNDPYDEGWIWAQTEFDPADLEELMGPEEYELFLHEEEE